MKFVCSWMLFGAIVLGPISGPSTLKAQPPSGAAPNHDEAPTDGEPKPLAGKPALPDGRPPRLGDKSASRGGEPAAEDAIIAIDVPDKPWSRGVSMENRMAARELFLEGNRLFRIPLFAKAAEKYVAALGSWKHPVIYLNLAIAQLNAGQDVEARDSLEHALEHGEEPLGTENFQGARQQLQEVERQLGRIRVSCRTEGAQVTLDGIPLFTAPGAYEGWVMAKDHEITAKKHDYLSEVRRVTVTPRDLPNIELKLITLSEAADASRRWATWKPWAVVAAGGVAVAAGGGLHALAFRNFRASDKVAGMICGDSADSHGCPEDVLNLRKYSDLLRQARRQQEIAVGGYVAGGSLAAVGVVLLYMNRPRLAEQEMETSFARRVAIIPTIYSGMVGMTVSVSH